MMFLLRCPTCTNTMRFAPATHDGMGEKKKRCVYCGRTFSVLGNIIKREA